MHGPPEEQDLSPLVLHRGIRTNWIGRLSRRSTDGSSGKCSGTRASRSPIDD